MKDEDTATKEQFVDGLVAMRQRIAELEGTVEINRELISALRMEPLLKEVLVMAADLADSEGASILVRDTSADELRCLVAFDAMSEKLMEASISVPIEGSIAGTILVSQEPLTVPNVQSDPCLCLYEEDDQQTRFKVRSLLGVPLRLRDQHIGVLLALNKRSDNEFSQKDVKALVALATHAATVIENVRLCQEVVDRTELQARLEELEAWAHTVTHDLKSLLGLIIGYTEVLVEDHAALPDEELSRYLRAVARSGRKINYMVNELLLLSGTGKMEVEIEPLDMGSIVAEALQRLTFLIEKHQAGIILPDTWPVALGCRPWVEEVWANYISNAIKYGGQPPRVELGATVQSNDVTTLMVGFWVRDNGLGLTPDQQARLFTPFTRLDQVRVQGHGLGLSIVRRIVEKLGGKVGIESEVGQGSVFTFSLPAADD